MFLFIDGPACLIDSLRMGQFSDPVATHPRTNEVEVLPPPPPGREGRDKSKSVCIYDKGITYSNKMRIDPGGARQLHLYGSVWPQDWKIDPSAD